MCRSPAGRWCMALSALIVDGRLADKDTGPPEAVATRLTSLLSDALAALGETKPNGARSNRKKRSLRRGRSAKPVNALWDRHDAAGAMGAMATVVVPWFADRYRDGADWRALAW
jgi:hypothetical protein